MSRPSGETVGVAIGTVAIRERPQRAVRDTHLIDLALERTVFPVVLAVCRDQDRLAVGGPGRRAVVVERTAGELARRAALGGQHEEVPVSILQIALAVGAVQEALDDTRRLRPGRALRLGGRRGEGLGVRAHVHQEGEPAPVGRPGDCLGRRRQVGEPRDLARVHPAHVELRARVVPRQKRQAAAVGREDRRGVVAAACAERARVAAVGAHDPECGAASVGHDVHRVAHEDDALAVGRDLRIARPLQLEHVERLESLRLRRAGERRRLGPADQKRHRPDGGLVLHRCDTSCHLMVCAATDLKTALAHDPRSADDADRGRGLVRDRRRRTP